MEKGVKEKRKSLSPSSLLLLLWGVGSGGGGYGEGDLHGAILCFVSCNPNLPMSPSEWACFWPLPHH